MRFDDPMAFTCGCGHTGNYSVDKLLALTEVCESCGFSLKSMGQSMRQSVDADYVFGRLATISIDLTKQFGVDLDNAEIESCITAADLASFACAKSPQLDRGEVLAWLVGQVGSFVHSDTLLVDENTPLHLALCKYVDG